MRQKQLATMILAAALLAGCGGAPSLAPMSAQSKIASSASARSVAEESIPSADLLKKLEATSPDQLIENAPAEPGANSKGFGPKPPAEDLGNFDKLNDGLWRGARPTDKGLEKLVSMGVKTIVNFENDKKVVLHEQQWCQAHNVKFVSIPLGVVLPPKESAINKFLDLATDKANYPLYFHCMQGRDRTGTAAFSYRVKVDGWKYDQAYGEMKAHHFHTYLLGLKAFTLWYANKYKKSQAAELAPAL